MACIRACVRNQGDLGPQVQYQTILYGVYIFFPLVLFSCELFSPALSNQQFSLSTLLRGKKEAEKQKQVLTEMAECMKKGL